VLSIVLLFSVTIIVAAEIAVVAVSMGDLARYRKGVFRDRYSDNVMALEFMFLVMALAITIILAWLIVVFRSNNPEVVLTLEIISLAAPVIISVRASWIIITHPNTLVRRLSLNHRQGNLTTTEFLEMPVPLTKILVEDLDTYNGDDD